MAPPDFELRQSRLSRSIRLSIAMAERIRDEYLHRKGEAVAAAEAADLAAAGETVDPEETERLREQVWERLAEDEVLDVRIDTLSADEFARGLPLARPPAGPVPAPAGLGRCRPGR